MHVFSDTPRNVGVELGDRNCLRNTLRTHWEHTKECQHGASWSQLRAPAVVVCPPPPAPPHPR